MKNTTTFGLALLYASMAPGAHRTISIKSEDVEERQVFAPLPSIGGHSSMSVAQLDAWARKRRRSAQTHRRKR